MCREPQVFIEHHRFVRLRVEHAVAIREDVADADPSLPSPAFEMYSNAKREAYSRLQVSGLEALMRYTLQQGLIKERVDYTALFHPSTLALEER